MSRMRATRARATGRLVVVGSVNVDLIARVPYLPAPGETILGQDVVVRAGGKGANQAVGAARLHPGVMFAGAVGADPYGELARTTLAAAGIDLAGLRVDGTAPTGLALITVADDGENCIVVSPGANARLDAGVAEELRFGPGDVVQLQLEIPVPTARAVAAAARAAAARVVLNAAPLPGERGPQLAGLLQDTDVLIVNEGEAAALSGRRGDWAEVALGLRDLGPVAVVVTLGAEGAVLAGPDGVARVPAYPVDVVDMTGAGDAFCAALAVALAGGADLVTAVRHGCAAGALATTRLGAQSALPDRSELSALLAAGEVA
jgi:ribokinase